MESPKTCQRARFQVFGAYLGFLGSSGHGPLQTQESKLVGERIWRQRAEFLRAAVGDDTGPICRSGPPRAQQRDRNRREEPRRASRRGPPPRHVVRRCHHRRPTCPTHDAQTPERGVCAWPRPAFSAWGRRPSALDGFSARVGPALVASAPGSSWRAFAPQGKKPGGRGGGGALRSFPCECVSQFCSTTGPDEDLREHVCIDSLH